MARTLARVRERLRNRGAAALITFQADTRLIEGLRTEAQIRRFRVTVDESVAAGGSDQGPTPVEMVLAALGTCQEIVYATYARILGIPLDAVEVRVTGSLDPRGYYGVADVPPGFRNISFAVELASPAAPDDVRRLIATVNQHCPVLDTLRRPLPVTGSYVHNGTRLIEP